MRRMAAIGAIVAIAATRLASGVTSYQKTGKNGRPKARRVFLFTIDEGVPRLKVSTNPLNRAVDTSTAYAGAGHTLLQELAGWTHVDTPTVTAEDLAFYRLEIPENTFCRKERIEVDQVPVVLHYVEGPQGTLAVAFESLEAEGSARSLVQFNRSRSGLPTATPLVSGVGPSGDEYIEKLKVYVRSIWKVEPPSLRVRKRGSYHTTPLAKSEVAR